MAELTRYWAFLGEARAQSFVAEAATAGIYAFLGVARGETQIESEPLLRAVMTAEGWADIVIMRADRLVENGLPADESLFKAMRHAAEKGAAFVLFPEPLRTS